MMRRLAAAAVTLITAALLAPLVPAAALAAETEPSSASGESPIVVVMDTSGSMSDEDGGGTVKIEGAKQAINGIIETLGGGTLFGFWTFPSDSDCAPGRYVLEPGKLTSTADAVSRVNAQKADGGTPTGEALQAVANDLRQRGYTSATIVLVSDGESTCDQPPCDVAKKLVADGFEVTVPTLGFRTSAAGSGELECIAKATGADYFVANDSAKLKEQLDALVTAKLNATVSFPKRVSTGGNTNITVHVDQTSGAPAKNIRAALIFNSKDFLGRRKTASPPVVPLGNLTTGSSREYAWAVGTSNTKEEVQFTVTVWADNADTITMNGLYSTVPAGEVNPTFGPIFDQVSSEHPLVIFGDSYSSGEGVGQPYLGTPTGVDAACHRSQSTYLAGSLPADEVTVLACSGAQTPALTKPWDRSSMSQIQEMRSYGIVPGAAAMTFGGNDIGFASIVESCLSPNGNCESPELLVAKQDEIGNLSAELAETYRTAWAAVNEPWMRTERGGQYAPLIVLTYPKVVHDASKGACVVGTNIGISGTNSSLNLGFTLKEVVVANKIVDSLNSQIRRSVAEAARDGYGVYLADVSGSMRPDHTLCAGFDDSYVNHVYERLPMSLEEFTWPPVVTNAESIHPKAIGYQAETMTLLGALADAEVRKPEVSDREISGALRGVGPSLTLTWPTRYEPDSSMLLMPGGTLQLNQSGYQPGSPVTVTLHSTPTVLGTVVADEDGVAAGELPVPEDVQLGEHELIVTGVLEDGEFSEVSSEVRVVAAVPFWVIGVAAVAVLALLVAVGFAITGTVKRRHARQTASEPVSTSP